ncbi:hypothetical protein [Alkalicoccus chagannorensis]|uniref:hypothetical protein n=1 Tax=Alkalicoccus chagannorensis TaxID=427072 RepID=UPI0039F105CF
MKRNIQLKQKIREQDFEMEEKDQLLEHQQVKIRQLLAQEAYLLNRLQKAEEDKHASHRGTYQAAEQAKRD